MPTAREQLKAYQSKRDFTKTAEPSGKTTKRKSKSDGLRFVVQKHDATRLHYDFRLEGCQHAGARRLPRDLQLEDDGITRDGSLRRSPRQIESLGQVRFRDNSLPWRKRFLVPLFYRAGKPVSSIQA